MGDGRGIPPVVCIVGPTASGKTDLAQEVALRIGGEVVGADSMQVYCGMDIGTGKLAPDRRRVPHYGIDLVNPGEPYSAAQFQAYARSCFADIAARGGRPLLCGGTGFYVRAAIDGYEFPPGEQRENPVRERYAAIAADEGARALWELLADTDPASAALIHENNTRRVVRAFELLEENTSYAEQHRGLQTLPQAVPAVFFGLEVAPDVLVQRIARRVDAMVAEGLVGEVESLLKQGFRTGITAGQAIGYKEIVSHLDGALSLEGAIAQIKTATRRYAKRQRSWFRRDPRIQWLHADSGDTPALAGQVVHGLAILAG